MAEEEKEEEEEEKKRKAEEEAVKKAEEEKLIELKKATENLDKANAEKKALLEREEKLVARKETLAALGGGSQAGQAPEKPKEETPAEYTKRIMSNQDGKYGEEAEG